MSNCNEVEARANNYENKGSLWTYFKNSFAWLTGMKKLIFDYSNFFGSGHFSIHQIWKNGSKKDRSQNVKGFKNYSFHACWPHERIFEICFVFTDFFARASTSLQFDIYDFRKKLFDLINFFWHELPKNHFPNSILRNVEYPTTQVHEFQMIVNFTKKRVKLRLYSFKVWANLQYEACTLG